MSRLPASFNREETPAFGAAGAIRNEELTRFAELIHDRLSFLVGALLESSGEVGGGRLCEVCCHCGDARQLGGFLRDGYAVDSLEIRIADFHDSFRDGRHGQHLGLVSCGSCCCVSMQIFKRDFHISATLRTGHCRRCKCQGRNITPLDRSWNHTGSCNRIVLCHTTRRYRSPMDRIPRNTY